MKLFRNRLSDAEKRLCEVMNARDKAVEQGASFESEVARLQVCL